MAVPRSHQFNPNLDPELLRSIEAAAAAYKPYRVELRSGYRPGDPRQHGKGEALDIQLYDPKTGSALDSYQGGGAITPYQQFANAWYQSLDPEHQKLARWGGYFGDPTSPDYGSKYGTQDYMHFDFGRSPGLGMLAGDWGTGFSADAMKKLGLSSAGGLGQIDAQMEAAGYTPEQRRAAIASIESSGDYNARGPEADPAGHRALGRYGVMDYNVPAWAEQYLHQSGVTADQFLKDPALQDKLFDAVYGDYVSKYGERGAASKWFTGSEKEPNVTDVNGKLTGKTYADRYMAALGGGGQAATSEDTTSRPSSPYKLPDKPKPTMKDRLKSAFSGMGEAMGGMGGGGEWQAPQLPPQPGASNVQAQARPIVDPNQAEARRAQLAMAMQRLNQGTLF